MRRYELISGSLFTLIALAQLARVLLRIPAQVGSFSVPIWFSFVAFVVAGVLAVWAFRSAKGVG